MITSEREKPPKQLEQHSSAPAEPEPGGVDAPNALSETDCQPDCNYELDEEARRALADVYDLLLNLPREQTSDKELLEPDEI